MITIASDPTTGPILSLDLADSTGRYPASVIPAGDWNRDLTWQAPDGGALVFHRAQRRGFSVECRLSQAQYRRLQQIIQRGNPVYLLPDFDEYTALSAPLSGSLRAWRRKASDATMEKVDPDTATRASVAYYTDPQNIIRQAASGEFRFMDSALGKGVVIEGGRGNVLTYPHPASGTLGWLNAAGSPTLEWDSTTPSKYLAAGGCLRVRNDTGAATVIVSTTGTVSAASGGYCFARVAMKGNARVYLGALIGAQAKQGADMQLTEDWQEIKVGPFLRTDTSTTLTLLVNIYDDGFDRTVYIGSAHAEEFAAPLKVGSHWTDQASPAADVLQYTVAHNPGNLTVAVSGIMPPTGAALRTFYCSGGGDSISGGFYNGNAFLEFGPSSISASIGAYTEGEPYHLIGRMSPEIGATVRLTGLNTDGSVRVIAEATNASAALGNYADATTLTVGANYPSSVKPIQFLRYDHRAWSDDEATMHERLYLEEHYRDLLMLTTGRRFRIASDTLSPVDGRKDFWRGVIQLEEVDADSDFQVAV